MLDNGINYDKHMYMEVIRGEEDRDPWEGQSLAIEALRFNLSDIRKLAPRPRTHGTIQRLSATDSGGRKSSRGARGSIAKNTLENDNQCPIPSLQALCLGVLALHLDELIEYGEQVLPLLPSEAKLSLLAAARRRGELADTAIKLLVDSSMPVLDVHSTVLKLSFAHILSAVRVMAPTLKYIDITGCVLRPRCLLSLAEAAPLIQVLRFGGFTAKDPEAMSEVLLRILPKLEQSENAIVDSWEEALLEEAQSASAGGGSGGNFSSSGALGGRLMHLRCLIWPEIPYETKVQCQNTAPAVCINLSREDVVARKLPTLFDPLIELDAEYSKGVAGHETWNLEQETCRNSKSKPSAVVHIAERFKMAYESQGKRLKKKDERLWRKATREVLSVSGGERAIREWEYGF